MLPRKAKECDGLVAVIKLLMSVFVLVAVSGERLHSTFNAFSHLFLLLIQINIKMGFCADIIILYTYILPIYSSI